MSAIADHLAEVVVGVAVVALPTGTALLWRIWRDGRQMTRDWRGSPARPGVDAVPGVMERMHGYEARFTAGDRHFAALDTQLTGMSDQLQRVADELPKNGMPAADKLDFVYRFVRDAITNQTQGQE